MGQFASALLDRVAFHRLFLRALPSCCERRKPDCHVRNVTPADGTLDLSLDTLDHRDATAAMMHESTPLTSVVTSFR